jgi:hypothetical protein
MSHEREPTEAPFWHLDEELGVGVFFDEAFTVRTRAHIAEESYRGRREIVPLAKAGNRFYVLIHPYILLPDISVTVDLSSSPSPSGQIGQVQSAGWEGMKHERIGDGQAWYYPADRTLVLWECILYQRYQQDENPLHDTNYANLWHGFEDFLVGRFPDARTIVTPSWEPDVKPQSWQAFLSFLGYKQLSQEAFAKGVVRP